MLWTREKHAEMASRLSNLIEELVKTERSYLMRIQALKKVRVTSRPYQLRNPGLVVFARMELPHILTVELCRPAAQVRQGGNEQDHPAV